MPKNKRAKKTDWKTEPMPKEHIVLSFLHQFSVKEYEKLQQGFVPDQMEDKWFIYFEDNKLYFHRSWVGFCIYIVEFEVGEKSSQIVKVIVNRDKNQYSETDNKWDLEFVVYLINLLLLNKSAHYPEKQGEIDSDADTLHQWSQVGRKMLESKEE